RAPMPATSRARPRTAVTAAQRPSCGAQMYPAKTRAGGSGRSATACPYARSSVTCPFPPQHRRRAVQTLIERADAFAMRAHASIGRLRRYTGMPQIAHAREVAQLVRDVGGDDAMIAAALLHDVRDEVLSISRVQILLEFGTDVDRL